LFAGLTVGSRKRTAIIVIAMFLLLAASVELVLLAVEWWAAVQTSSLFEASGVEMRNIVPLEKPEGWESTAQELAVRYVPRLYVSSEEPHVLLGYHWRAVSAGHSLCLQYWVEWDRSSIEEGPLAWVGYTAAHDLDLEPLFIYLDSSGSITHAAYTAGHGTRGTLLADDASFVEETHLEFEVVLGTHHYRPCAGEQPCAGEPVNQPKLTPLDGPMIAAWNAVLARLPQPGTMDAIVQNPWRFFDLPGAGFNVFLGDYSGRVFYEPL